MNIVVVQEVERFVFRPHLPARAVYFAVIFLNQIVLSKHPEQGQFTAHMAARFYCRDILCGAEPALVNPTLRCL